MAFKVPENFRVKTGGLASSESYGNNGLFLVKSMNLTRALTVIASDGADWEHVSVSLQDRTPTWDEMSFIKGLFWGEDDLVVQFHPIKSEYINNHDHCLHLWRKKDTNDFCERPDSIFIGIKA